MQPLSFTLLVSFLASIQLVSSQLTGAVGPTTTTAFKAAKICNVLDYGGVASTTSDLGPALTSAFAACKNRGTVYVPEGHFGLATFPDLVGGVSWALQIDGIIYRTGSLTSGTMISIENSVDFEFFSKTSTGAIQGYGYEFHPSGTYGPRLLRLTNVTDFSIHNIALVDSPAFHLTIVECFNAEVYNMIIYGANLGGLDGVDVSGTNIWVHDVEVTNKDECITIKNPSSNILVQNIYCNWSGGCAVGSLGSDTDISLITYENIYTWQSNQMFMLKSNGGDGSVSKSSFNNFIGHSNAYSLYVDAFWTDAALAPGLGVVYTDLTFNNWTGTCADGVQRAPVIVDCPVGAPCTDITISEFAMWTDTGSEELYKCINAAGSGACLDSSVRTVTSTITAAPAGYTAAKMPNDLVTGFATESSIPIPPIPTTFFPGLKPISAS